MTKKDKTPKHPNLGRVYAKLNLFLSSIYLSFCSFCHLTIGSFLKAEKNLLYYYCFYCYSSWINQSLYLLMIILALSWIAYY